MKVIKSFIVLIIRLVPFYIYIKKVKVLIPKKFVRSFSDLRNIKKFPRHEPGIIDYIYNNISKYDEFWDIGANIGFYAIYVSNLNSKIKVYAIEAVDETFSRMQTLINYNSCRRIKTLKIVCGDQSKNVYHPITECGTSSLVLKLPKSGYIKTNSYSFDTISPPSSVKKLVLIDVDGFELSVVRGMLKNIEQGVDILIELHPNELKRNGDCLFKLIKLLHDYSYEISLLHYLKCRKRDHKQMHILALKK